MYLQNEPRLYPEIQKVGCLYLSMLRIYELLSGRDIQLADVNLIWILSKQRHYLDEKSNMKQMDGVFRLAKQTIGYDKLAFTIGLLEDDKTVYWDWVNRSKELQDTKFMIENLKTYGVEGNHFVLCNSQKEMLFDSYSFREYKAEHIGRFHLINHY